LNPDPDKKKIVSDPQHCNELLYSGSFFSLLFGLKKGRPLLLYILASLPLSSDDVHCAVLFSRCFSFLACKTLFGLEKGMSFHPE
jgi:hypothetical protein